MAQAGSDRALGGVSFPALRKEGGGPSHQTELLEATPYRVLDLPTAAVPA